VIYPGDLPLGDALHYIGGILEFSFMKLSLAGFQPEPFIYRVSNYLDLRSGSLGFAAAELTVHHGSQPASQCSTLSVSDPGNAGCPGVP
jgi:hypothetical protein